MAKIKFYLIFTIVAVAILMSQFTPQKAQASYDMNLILSDSYFTNASSMSASQINDFLVSHGSVYANYVIPRYVDVPYPYAGGNWDTVSVEQVNSGTGGTFYNKTVAQLIYDECQSHQINPRVMLAIMQKESSVIEQSSVSSTRMAWPLFYGFNETMASFGYDQGTSQAISIDYGGVGQQIAYSTWNFRDKFDKWNNGTYGDWRAAISIDGTTVSPQSVATRLLYSYTPHSWQTFLNVLSTWGWSEVTYSYSFISQTAYPAIRRGDADTLSVTILNTGTATWTQDSMHLGTARAQNRIPDFARGAGWVSGNRVMMQESSVAPGDTATFSFSISPRAWKALGTYTEFFQPVADCVGGGWLRDIGIYWNVTVLPELSITDTYKYDFVSQSAYPSLTRGGDNATMSLTIRNTGTATWSPLGVHLGTSNPLDRLTVFSRGSGWISANRITMQESSVAPGQTATFVFDTGASTRLSPGIYREYFRPVADGYTWMFDKGIYWDMTVS